MPDFKKPKEQNTGPDPIAWLGNFLNVLVQDINSRWDYALKSGDDPMFPGMEGSPTQEEMQNLALGMGMALPGSGLKIAAKNTPEMAGVAQEARKAIQELGKVFENVGAGIHGIRGEVTPPIYSQFGSQKASAFYDPVTQWITMLARSRKNIPTIAAHEAGHATDYAIADALGGRLTQYDLPNMNLRLSRLLDEPQLARGFSRDLRNWSDTVAKTPELIPEVLQYYGNKPMPLWRSSIPVDEQLAQLLAQYTTQPQAVEAMPKTLQKLLGWMARGTPEAVVRNPGNVSSDMAMRRAVEQVLDQLISRGP